MKPEPSIFDLPDEDGDARREAEAVADVAAGRVISNDEICAWLETWGTPDETPAPAKWFKSSGRAATAQGDAIKKGPPVSRRALH